MMNDKLQTRYLKCLQAERKTPSHDELRSLVHRHLHRFPFENVSKFHYYLQGGSGLQWVPSLETFLDEFERNGLGGNCYILNAHFGSLLQSLGYEVELVRATGGNTHLANRVAVEGRMYYVDVGYGAPLFEPLSLEEEPRFNRCGEEVEIIRLEADRFLIDRRAGGQSFVAKTIEWSPVAWESFDEVIAHSLRDEADNPFMRRIVATVFKKGTAYSVINRKLMIKRDHGSEVHEFTWKQEWMEMMNVTFGFSKERLAQAVDFVESREGAARLFADG